MWIDPIQSYEENTNSPTIDYAHVATQAKEIIFLLYILLEFRSFVLFLLIIIFYFDFFQLGKLNQNLRNFNFFQFSAISESTLFFQFSFIFWLNFIDLFILIVIRLMRSN